MTDEELGVMLDHLRGFHARIVKPFATLPEVIEGVQRARQAQREAEARLRDLTNYTLEADKAAAEAEATLAVVREHTTAEQAALTKDLDTLRERVHEARNQAQADIANARAHAAAEIQDAQTEAAAHKAALLAEIAALETRKADLDKNLEATREMARAMLTGGR
jgi:hypothetical protein